MLMPRNGMTHGLTLGMRYMNKVVCMYVPPPEIRGCFFTVEKNTNFAKIKLLKG